MSLSDNSPKGLIIDDHDVYEGQVLVDQFWTVYDVGRVVDKHATKQPCQNQKAIIPKDSNSEHNNQQNSYAFETAFHWLKHFVHV